MNISIGFLFSLIVFTHIPSNIGNFVVTEFDTDTMKTYFYALKKYTNNNIGDMLTGRNLFKFCHFLRQSKIFRVAMSTSQEPSDPVRQFKIPEEKLKYEKDQLLIWRRKFKVKRSKNLEKLSYFRCLDLEGYMRWFISSAFIPDSTFLFTINQDFYYLIEREHTGRAELFPHLTAIIDESATIVLDSVRNGATAMIEKFNRSMKSSDSESRDKLCDLNPVMKYRLCTIAANELEGNFYCPIEHPITSPQLYSDLTHNLYYNPSKSEEDCHEPIIKLAPHYPEATKLHYKLLNCSFLVTKDEGERVRLEFQLSLNTLESDTLFTLSRSRETDQTIIHEMEVPLLRHLTDYSNALQNVTIKLKSNKLII